MGCNEEDSFLNTQAVWEVVIRQRLALLREEPDASRALPAGNYCCSRRTAVASIGGQTLWCLNSGLLCTSTSML